MTSARAVPRPSAAAVRARRPDPRRARGGDTYRVSDQSGGLAVFGESPGRVPAATIAAQRVAEVRDRPRGRLDLLQSSYTPPPGTAPLHLPYPRAALAFMGWQLRRGLLNPLDDERPGSPWWRAVNTRLLRDTCEARLRVLGHPGPASSPSVDPSVRFARQPSPRTWYLAHNVTIARAYLDNQELAERENRVERFFINLVLVRVLYAHALVAAPRLALAWLAPIGRWLGDPRLDMTGMFLSVSRVLPHRYPLDGELDDYIADEHAIGRLLDLGVIVPRLTELYRWSADELRIPDITDLVCDATPAYAWDPRDREPWAPPPRPLVRVVRRVLPPPPSAPASTFSG
jgi:hypothetical protein